MRRNRVQFSCFVLLVPTTTAIGGGRGTWPSPTTPAALLKQWEILDDPNPMEPIAVLEETTSVEEIDSVLERVIGTDGGIIIQRFRPSPTWLWRQWFGTVFFHSAPAVIWNMGLAFLFCVSTRYLSEGDFNVLAVPTSGAYPRLEAIDKIWKTLMSLTTFLLTFFVGQAYAFWRNFLDQGRGIQGRFNDINMLMATNAARRRSRSIHNKNTYTKEAVACLDSLSAKLRACHLLFWAANAPRFRVLLTDQGLNRMVERGCLPRSTKYRLDEIDLPITQKWASVLESAMKDCQDAIRDRSKTQRYSVALEQVLLDQFCRLRGLCASIPDLVDGRMPLAYAHFVQVLVDLFLIAAPIAQYPEIGIFSVVLVGILTLFYRGLLDLAKVFLDPLDSEDYCEGAVFLNLAVLIREANSASTRWMKGAAKL